MLHGEPCTLRGRIQSPARQRWWTAMLWQKPCTVLISACSPSDVGHVQCTTSTGRPAACFVCQDSMYQEFIAGEAVHCLPSAGMSLPEALVIRGEIHPAMQCCRPRKSFTHQQPKYTGCSNCSPTSAALAWCRIPCQKYIYIRVATCSMQASYLIENGIAGQIQLHTQIIDWQGRHNGCGPAGIQIGVAGVGQLQKQGPAAQLKDC